MITISWINFPKKNQSKQQKEEETAYAPDIQSLQQATPVLHLTD